MDNTRTAILFALMLPGCSASPPPPEPEQQIAQLAPLPPVPANTIVRDLPLEPPEVSHLCKLGTSCLDLDSRPFEVCLVGAKHCVDKAVELTPVESPEAQKEPYSGTPVRQKPD